MEDKLEKLKKKNDLSDIILEKDTSNGDSIKKLLLLAASLVLLFLIVLIGMKMFNNSNISPSENLASVGENIEETSDAMVDSTKTALEENGDALFKKEAIIDENSETDLKFEEMVRKLKQQDAQENQDVAVKDLNENLSTVVDTPKELVATTKESVVDKIKEITPKPTVTIKKDEPREVIKIVTPKIVTPKIVAPSKTIAPSKPEPKEIIISTHDDYVAAPSPISTMSGYFIQVGATSKAFPDRRFLQKIKNTGFDYIVHKVLIKGRNIKKVLVGPYNTRDQARNDLSSIQSTINPSAYIYRIK